MDRRVAHWAAVHSEDGESSPLRLLVVQPTPFCNIDCRYCYLPDRSDKHRLSLSTFQRLLERLSDEGLYGATLTILWHGGEPLAVPLSFYRQAFEVAVNIIPSSCEFRFNFQTNATLITDEFCAFVNEIGAHVGVSIDGPKGTNDRWRVYRSGGGTFKRIIEGIEKLKSSGIPFSSISVVTRDSLDDPSQLYDFLMSLGSEHVGLNVDEIEAANRNSSFEGNINRNVESIEGFYKHIFRRYAFEKPATKLREFDQIRSSITRGGEIFSRLSNPLSIISVSSRGDVSTYAPELLYDSRFTFGNVHVDRLEDIFSKPGFLALKAEIDAGVALCRETCAYFTVCGGGCPSNKISENGTANSTETLHCRLTKMALTDAALSVLEAEYGLHSRGYVEG